MSERNYVGKRPKKSLGQNFLTDKNIIDKIISSAEITDKTMVIEIGPGKGALTCELAKRSRKLIAIEIDSDLISDLQLTLSKYGDNFTIINDDILKINIRELIQDQDGVYDKIIILGNLPYYITTPIIMNILTGDVGADQLIFMMQKEVGDRIVSGPGSKTYGAISVAVNYYAEVERLMNVSANSFYPKPKVESTVLKFNLRKMPTVDIEEEKLLRVIKAGFARRRKTLANTLMTLGNISKEEIQEALKSCDIDPARRAETLTLEEFAAIANLIG